MPVYQARELLTAGTGGVGLISPDGRWVPFWAAHEGQTAADAVYQLAFLDTGTLDTCTHADLTATAAEIGESAVVTGWWDADSRATMKVGREWVRGEPCGAFEPVATPASLDHFDVPSPNGRYRVEADLVRAGMGVELVLIEVATGRAVVTRSWEDAARTVFGGVWLDDSRFLLFGTAEQGPLLIDTAGSTVEVLPEFFGLDALPDDPGEWIVWGAVDQTTDSLHLLLENLEENGPLLLYHGENGDVEPLPFAATWDLSRGAVSHHGFSPDGSLLLLSMPFGVESDLWSNPIWLRPVDGERADVYAVPGWNSVMPPERQDIVASRIRLEGAGSVSVAVLTFPGGQVLQRWQVDGLSLSPVGWSPDGAKLLLRSAGSGEPGAGPTLFLADVGDPPRQ